MPARIVFAVVLIASWRSAFVAAAEEPREFFEKRVRPILVERCFGCHTADHSESKLRLDSRAAILAGGERGPAVVPGKPDKSLLVLAIRHNEELKMPPKKKLSTAERKVLTQWVKQGAFWPNSKPEKVARPHPRSPQKFTQDERSFWSLQPPQAPRIPPVKNSSWVRSPIDRFVLSRLEKRGLSPARAADKRVWIRRATFDLIGLPPTPEDVADFLADGSPDAFEKVVERLLASPRYGERWGRHWLDVARYADSNGLDENLSYANAWRYRDWVIAAFNADMPYDRFVREQLAGDLLPPAGDAAKDSRRMIATGFLTLGPKMLAEDDPRKMQMDIVDEQIDTTGKAFLGLWLGCARCHDHKFDPIRIEDYYGLAGIFKSTRTMENFKVVAKWQERPIVTGDADADAVDRQRKVAALLHSIETLRTSAQAKVLNRAKQQIASYLLAAEQQRQIDELARTTAMLGPKTEKQKPDGFQLIEAEDFRRGNVGKDTTNYGKAIGIILNIGPRPNFAEYDIHIKKAGFYRLELRYAAADARPVRVLINAALVKRDAAATATGSWYPKNQRWELVGFYRFKKGKNTLRLDRADVFPHIDKLLIAPASAEAAKVFSARPIAGTHPILVRRWMTYLKNLPDSTTSPFIIWSRFVRGVRGKALLAGLPLKVRESFANPPDSLSALAKTIATLDLSAVEAGPKGPLRAGSDLESAFDNRSRRRLEADRKALAVLRKGKRNIPVAMAVSEGNIANLRVHLRGSYLTLGNEVPRRVPSVFTHTDPVGRKTSGRLELANWISSPSNPLAARVIVNRLWRWHFGRGIVRTPNNFGRLGARPTNQPLLDWLAVELVRRDWSLKSLHREILLSSTYRMSSRFDPTAAKMDPENRLLWRRNRRRVDAEAYRDSLLYVAGNLDSRMTGSLLKVKNRGYVTGTGSNLPPGTFESARRSVYLPVIRSALYDVLQTLDFADPSASNGNRVATTIPAQALLMMNSKLMTGQSMALADRLLKRPGATDSVRVEEAFRFLFSREPAAKEITRLTAFLAEYERRIREIDPDEKNARRKAWQALCRVLLSSNEFLTLE